MFESLWEFVFNTVHWWYCILYELANHDRCVYYVFLVLLSIAAGRIRANQILSAALVLADRVIQAQSKGHVKINNVDHLSFLGMRGTHSDFNRSHCFSLHRAKTKSRVHKSDNWLYAAAYDLCSWLCFLITLRCAPASTRAPGNVPLRALWSIDLLVWIPYSGI